MADVQGKKIDVMFLFYEKEVHNILEDNIFETQCYDLNLVDNLFYTDSILLKGDNWIDSRQWQFYEAGDSTLDQGLDVYFQWLSFCYCTDYEPQGRFYKRWDKTLGRCNCGGHAVANTDSYAANVLWNHIYQTGTPNLQIDVCPSQTTTSTALE